MLPFPMIYNSYIVLHYFTLYSAFLKVCINKDAECRLEIEHKTIIQLIFITVVLFSGQAMLIVLCERQENSF